MSVPSPSTGRAAADQAAGPLSELVADATDRAGLGAAVPELLLEMQFRLGALAAVASDLTERGRRPFRPDDSWRLALSRLAFDVYVLADQTGIDLEAAVRRTAAELAAGPPTEPDDWPFPAN